MNTLFFYVMLFGENLKQNLKAAANKFFKEEDGAVDLIAIVVLIGIVVLLAIVFRKQIANLINSLLETITKNATDAVNE